MKTFCQVDIANGKAVCRVCGAVYKTDSSNVRAVCGVDRTPQKAEGEGGVGTELKGMLKKIGINPTPTCKCNKRAKMMDANGIQWCEEHIEEISGWLAEEAANRGLPYIHAAGRVLIKMAIKKARKAQNNV